jgi:hypothetical protein
VGDERRDERRDGDGTPHCWNPELLLRRPGEFDDGVVVLPRYGGEGIFGPSMYGFPVRWT